MSCYRKSLLRTTGCSRADYKGCSRADQTGCSRPDQTGCSRADQTGCSRADQTGCSLDDVGCSGSDQAVYAAKEMSPSVNACPEDGHAGFEESEDFQRFRALVREHILEGRLLDVDGKKNYKVYRLRSQKFGAHESVVVTYDDQNYVTIELLVDDETRQTSLGSMSYDGASDKLRPCGVVRTSAHELFVTAYKTMKKFGPFNKLFNNCQDFCNDYLRNIGFPEQRKLTDPKKITRCGIDCG